MKESFKEYLPLTSGKIKDQWEKGLIVLDTNILLDFYCFREDTLNDYYKVLSKLKERNQLWIPYYVGYEYFEGRIKIINTQVRPYDSVLGAFENTISKIEGLKNGYANHPYLNFDEISEEYKAAIQKLKKKVEKSKREHPDYIGNDKVLIELKKIYDDSIIGEELEQDQLDIIQKDGAKRYELKIPPGFKDDEKEGRNPYYAKKYGDLIIWKQILEKAKESGRSIIFVTNDAKDDWIEKAGDRKLGALPALKKEMYSYAEVGFTLYSSDEFLAKALEELKLPIKNASIQEVKKYREFEYNKVLKDSIYPQAFYHHAQDRFLRTDPSRLLHLYHAHIDEARRLVNDISRLNQPEFFEDTESPGARIDAIKSGLDELHQMIKEADRRVDSLQIVSARRLTASVRRSARALAYILKDIPSRQLLDVMQEANSAVRRIEHNQSFDFNEF